MAERRTKRTSIEDISAFGERLSDAEMRLVSGGGGATSTADNRTCDEDGTSGGSLGTSGLEVIVAATTTEVARPHAN
jgi:hypothetical protein